MCSFLGGKEKGVTGAYGGLEKSSGEVFLERI